MTNKKYQFKEDSFQLVQVDKKIHDVKFETKATTFAKDALKRFVKNKSSVVGAIIIGFLLLCSLILPIIIPYDISSTHADQALLPPRLFNPGTGFWDGTKKYENILYDGSQEGPAGFNGEYVVEYTAINDEEFIDQYSPYAVGGSIAMTAAAPLVSGTGKYENPYILQNYYGFDVTADGNYVVNIELGDTAGVFGNVLGEYRILLNYGSSSIVLADWSQNYGSLSFNLSEIISEKGLSEINNAIIKFELARHATAKSYILINKIEITADIEDEAELERLAEISMTDANKAVGMVKLPDGTFPLGYWRANATRYVYHAVVRYVSFVYDTYGAQLGAKEMIIGGSDMKKYVANGWCEYDFEVGPESFKLLDAKNCPVSEVYTQSYDAKDDIYSITARVTYYKYLGYDSMPRYLLGTTDQGKDIIKSAFNGLRTSLLIAIFASAVCFTIGIIWGSISGYFGGNVDLFMERFCEILGGVPWIVVMTLAILLFGNNIVTFALALCFTGWLGVAARTRTQFYRFKGREYVLASRTLGSSDKRLIFKHILPNALGTIVTSSVLMIPSVIFSEATLSYLNLGLQGVDSFGLVLSNNQKYLSTYPALVIFPAIIISLLMISFNLFGNGLRDALNPSLKGSE